MKAVLGERTVRDFPRLAGVLLGLALGGLFDGIVLHQLLQWHHMLTSAGYPADSVDNLQVNTLWDGLFHLVAYIFLGAGLAMFWKHARSRHAWWSGKMLAGTLLIGWGIFNIVEGLINHHMLGIHHVNETVPETQWIAWDLGFLLWGAAMLLAGLWLLDDARRRVAAARATSAPTPQPSSAIPRRY